MAAVSDQSARLVGREVMPYVKAMAILERIMQDGCFGCDRH